MSEWRPSGCGQDRQGPEANFNWPTDLAMNPVTNTLALIDQVGRISASKTDLFTSFLKVK
jgi:hypothetical protein